jgi:polysaccharide biosynthesis protein PslH
MQYVPELKKICKEVYPFRIKLSKKLSAINMLFSLKPWDAIAFYKKEAAFKVREIIDSQNFDLVWVNFLSMANYIEPNMKSKSIYVLDQHNADELVWENYAKLSHNLAMKIFAAINLRKLRVFQKEKMKIFRAVACVSSDEAAYMKTHIPKTVATWLIPNGVDTEYFRPINSKDKRDNVIMLCASMDVTMNIDAALRFAKEAFPRIKSEIPDCKFWIVGRNPPAQIQALNNDEHILVTGSVEDVRPFYSKAKIIVAPYLFGGGTKLKILEAMSMNIPIVSTTIGCHGIDFTKDTQITIRDNMNEMAEAIISLLKHELSTSNSGKNDARELVEAKYSWEGIGEIIENRLTKLFN